MLRHWKPFREMEALQREINRAFEATTGRRVGLGETQYPLLDVSETDDEIKVRSLLPGLSRDAVKITLQQNVLTISGEMQAAQLPEGARSLRQERPSGLFQRTLRLRTPLDEDQIQARLQDGVLTVTLPRREEARPRKIEIGVE